MLPGGLGDAGQAGDCVKQFQYVRVFEHCRVHMFGHHPATVQLWLGASGTQDLRAL
jgi:hypothetical protein